MKNILLILIGFVAFGTSAQTTRLQVEGRIYMPDEEDVQGISIYNVNTAQGTVTNNQGAFDLNVAKNDSIQVSAVQFQEFIVIIDEGVIESGIINIRVNEVVNQLPEVIVSPYDLTGNVNVDISRIRVITTADTLDGREVQNMYFKADTLPNYQSPPRNTALHMGNTRLVNGLNFVNLFKELLAAGKKGQESSVGGDLSANVRGIYNDEFFRENLNIEEEHISDFIFFADQQGLDDGMLREGNELDLIEFLINQSVIYKKQQIRR